MACFDPYFGRPRNDAYRVPLPCGHCEYCRWRQSRLWTFRLAVELDAWHNRALYVTLTYDDDHLPDGANLKRSHISGFFKRLRYYLGKDVKIKYYACGEYGDRYGRPHYHAIIYGLDESHIPCLKLAWRFGMVRKPSAVRGTEAISYVCGYVQKKLGKQSTHREFYGDREPFFANMSKGLGLGLVNKLKSFTSFVFVDGKIRPLGRYLTHKLAEKFGILEQYKDFSYQQFFMNAVEMYQKHGLNETLDTCSWQDSPERAIYLKENKQFMRDFLQRCKIFNSQRSLDEKIKIQSLA